MDPLNTIDELISKCLLQMRKTLNWKDEFQVYEWYSYSYYSVIILCLSWQFLWMLSFIFSSWCLFTSWKLMGLII